MRSERIIERRLRICQRYQSNRNCRFNFICHGIIQSFDNKSQLDTQGREYVEINELTFIKR